MNGLTTTADQFSFPARELSQQLLEHIQGGKIGYWEHKFDLLAGEGQIPHWNLCIANGQILYSDNRLWSIPSLMKIIHRYLPHIRNQSIKQRLGEISAQAEQQSQTPGELFAQIEKIGIVNSTQLQKAIETKILNDLDTYLLMGSGNATFIEDRDSLIKFPIAGFQPTTILNQAKQRQIAWERLQQYVPSMNSIPILNHQALEKANLPAGQQERIENLVKSSHTLNTLAAKMAKDTLEIAEMFGKLANMGLVSFQPQAKNAPAPIMVIDDSLPILLQFQHWVVGLGYPVVICQHSESALAKIFEIEPAVIFIDINMPGLSGFDLVKLIRKQPRLADIPLVILTGEQKLANRWRAQWTGCDFLTKPLAQASICEFQVQIEKLLFELVGKNKVAINNSYSLN
jgi:CheY-like chemotaxis protein